jgi:hypothetical protein
MAHLHDQLLLGADGGAILSGDWFVLERRLGDAVLEQLLAETEVRSRVEASKHGKRIWELEKNIRATTLIERLKR